RLRLSAEPPGNAECGVRNAESRTSGLFRFGAGRRPILTRGPVGLHSAFRTPHSALLGQSIFTLTPKFFFSSLMKYVVQAASMRSGLKFTRSMLYLAMFIIWSRMSRGWHMRNGRFFGLYHLLIR